MLNGWKAIAAHLRRDERTAMRWAAERGLPVHRLPGRGRGSVYALADEIEGWLAADRDRAAAPAAVVAQSAPVPPRRWWRRRHWVAPGLTVSGALLVAAAALTLHRPAAGEAGGSPAFTDPAAKTLYLQASYDWNLRTPHSLTRAVREYGGAIGRDPGVAAPYVGLANTYLLLREFGSMPDAVAYPRAEGAARAAIALAPDSADAHRALGFIDFWWRQDRAGAAGAFARAIALRPADPLTHHWFATALLANAEPAAALREITTARDLDPTSTAVLADRGLILYAAGRRAEGLDALRTLAREQPGAAGPHRALAEIALTVGRADLFLREAAAAAALRGDAGELAKLRRWREAGLGGTALLAAMLDDARPAAATRGWFPVAQLASLAGRGDEARAALGRACAAHEPAAVSAPSSLWLARSVSRAEIAARCDHRSLL